MSTLGGKERTTVLGRLFGVQKDNNDDDGLFINVFFLINKCLGAFIDEANLYKKDLLVIHNKLDNVARGELTLNNDELGSLIERYGRSASLG